MKRFKTIQDWLKSNPTEEEQTKVLILIHRGETSRIRKELWQKEQYLRKLQSLANHFKRLDLPLPKSEADSIAEVKKEIESLKKDLPPVQKKEQKVSEVLAESSEK
jgi:ADP-heptose:LPS heptosyltransferase